LPRALMDLGMEFLSLEWCVTYGLCALEGLG
uniref:Uncharacterized protein n=1 Tax=Caenorhabditis japonica TaxID=281687 RepID=A0A8R1E5Q9_CAEJA